MSRFPATLLILLAACSPSGPEPGGGELHLVTCSLGCSSGAGGMPVSCAISLVPRNVELAVTFSEPVDLHSVGPQSFRVADVLSGAPAAGQFFLDPLDPRRLVFRPALFFDGSGHVHTSLEPGRTYEVRLRAGDEEPVIRSLGGRPNRTPLACSFMVGGDWYDAVPGDPQVDVFVRTVESGESEPVVRELEPGEELTGLHRESPIEFVFHDLMNIASLVHPGTGQLPSLQIRIDEDGNPLTTGDRWVVPGHATVELDLEALRTRLTFTPDPPLPTAGFHATPRRVFVLIPPSVVDLAGRSVQAEGLRRAVPEGSDSFVRSLLELDGPEDVDSSRSAGEWSTDGFVPGWTGGSGCLGDLVLEPGEVLLLNTDAQAFPLPGRPAHDLWVHPDATLGGDPNLVDHPADYDVQVTVRGGAFSFARLHLAAGSRLRLVGDGPARLGSAGAAGILGMLDLSGVEGGEHDSSTLLSPPGPAAPAGAGKGGDGGGRFDLSHAPDLLALAYTTDAESDARDHPGSQPSGKEGGGLAPGRGGLSFPDSLPSGVSASDPHGVTLQVGPGFGHGSGCWSWMVGAPGGGGGHATDGGDGIPSPPFPFADAPFGASNSPRPTAGGRSSALGLLPPNLEGFGYGPRRLDWTEGFLRGGSGGGGGGAHPFGTRVQAAGEGCLGPGSTFRAWHDHSGARGGSGGGALQLASGTRIKLEGTIDLRGGRGGSARPQTAPAPPFLHDFGAYAMPGGGGAGGAVRLMAPEVEWTGTVDVSGGPGGTSPLGAGGHGGTGLVRIEDQVGTIEAKDLAPKVNPWCPATTSVDWLSVAPGALRARPSARPDSVSCLTTRWLQPESGHHLSFVPDRPGALGWDLDLIWLGSGSPEVVPFRGKSEAFPEGFEGRYGSELGSGLGAELRPGERASPVVVRFQGARIVDGEPLEGTLTPWVDHPAILNHWSPAPTAFRCRVVFDGTQKGQDDPGTALRWVRAVAGLRVLYVAE